MRTDFSRVHLAVNTGANLEGSQVPCTLPAGLSSPHVFKTGSAKMGCCQRGSIFRYEFDRSFAGCNLIIAQ